MENGRQQLRLLMNQYLSLSDIQDICFDLNIPYDHLSGDNVPIKVRALIEHMEQEERLPDLLRTLREHRPRAQWPDEASLQPRRGGSRTALSAGEISPELRDYCRAIIQQCGRLPLRGRDPKASDATRLANPLGLANVYIALDTTRGGAVLGTVAQNPTLVLLGAPGGGKTTFVHHLAYTLAQQALEGDTSGNAVVPTAVEAPTPIPLLITLRDFAASLPNPLPTPTASHLWQFITHHLTHQGLANAAEPLRGLREKGQLFFLLDGLDEVPNAEQRLFVREAIAQFQENYPSNRFLITCRVLSYQPPDHPSLPDLRLPERRFPQAEIAPFSPKKIEAFITAWYTELHQAGEVNNPRALIAELQKAVRRPDLQTLARNPLLLTAMALVHSHAGQLPDTRALLYENVIDLLLWQWEQIKNSDTRGNAAQTPVLLQLLEEVGRKKTDLKRVLRQLAYETHQLSGIHTEAADIGELALQTALAALHITPDLPKGDVGWAQRVIAVMKLRAGLLIERAPHVFAFPHRTFQEYLAGAHLASQPKFASLACGLATSNTPQWREAILLAVGRLVYVSEESDKPLLLVSELCPDKLPQEEQDWRKAWLAGEALLEMGLRTVQDSRTGRDLLVRLQSRLAQLVAGGHLPPRERMTVGDVLGRLGDPRPGVMSLEPEMIPIPAGPFLMGDEKYTVTLPAFAIAKYATTNAQYRFFVEAGGYTNPTYWIKEGWQECQQRHWQAPNYWEDARFNAPNQPVVGVSWYEAMAYTAWLGHQTGKPYRLPTEAEWERAARHTDGRSYPWGNEMIEDCANYDKLNLGRSTAVGLFPKGAARCGALDLVGNVWEWCMDWVGPETITPSPASSGTSSGTSKALHGGSWYSYALPFRSAPSYIYTPDNRFNLLGFRCAVS